MDTEIRWHLVKGSRRDGASVNCVVAETVKNDAQAHTYPAVEEVQGGKDAGPKHTCRIWCASRELITARRGVEGGSPSRGRLGERGRENNGDIMVSTRAAG